MKIHVEAGPGRPGPAYCAYTDDYDGAPNEPGGCSPDPIGYGATEAEAREDLAVKLAEQAEDEAARKGWPLFVCPDADGEVTVWKPRGNRPIALATYTPGGISFHRNPTLLELREICDALDRPDAFVEDDECPTCGGRGGHRHLPRRDRLPGVRRAGLPRSAAGLRSERGVVMRRQTIRNLIQSFGEALTTTGVLWLGIWLGSALHYDDPSLWPVLVLWIAGGIVRGIGEVAP